MSHLDMGAQKCTVKGPAAAPANELTGPRFADTIALWMLGPPAISAPMVAAPAAALKPISCTSLSWPMASLYSMARRIWLLCAKTFDTWQAQSARLRGCTIHAQRAKSEE